MFTGRMKGDDVMETAAIIAAVSGLMQIAFNLWSTAKQNEGTEPIPEWEEIVAKNLLLQAKIDAEK
jgi:hypothetical protein